MSLFKHSKKSEEKSSGNIPEGLGIEQERANDIIDAVRSTYREYRGNVNKVFDEIKAEKLSENEAIFAYYVVGAVKVKEGEEMAEGLSGLLEMFKELRDEMEDK